MTIYCMQMTQAYLINDHFSVVASHKAAVCFFLLLFHINMQAFLWSYAVFHSAVGK